ncbi:MAG: PEP-CTERM sorting domain-containing protein [Deltaproteobacteria bacterium]|nr:PEP-CTERM sorting domain-containing protein [Deltaproteobacteria bacterium]
MLQLRSMLGRLLLAGGALTLSTAASAASFPTIASTTVAGPNTLALTLRIECSGFACSFIGLGSPYQQTQTSTLSGTTGLRPDDTADTIRFSTDAAGTTDLMSLDGTSITFTGLNSTVTGGGTTVTINLSTGANGVFASSAGLGSISGFDILTPPQSIGFSLTGANAISVGANATTDAPNFPTFNLTPTLVDSLGTFQYFGDSDSDVFPEFGVQNLRGAFAFMSSTVTFGQTIRITMRATFTLNFKGESTTPIPEPGSLLLVAGGLAGFGAAAVRRRRGA